MDKDVTGQKMGQPDENQNEPVDKERRDTLQRLAKFGAYTAPALLAVLTSEKAPAQTDDPV